MDFSDRGPPLQVTTPMPNIRILWYAEDIVIVNLIEQDFIVIPRIYFEI
jgi:hypothetical protein